MKIKDYRFHAARVPYEEHRSGTHLILRLFTDDGIEGISYVSRVAGEALRLLQSLTTSYLDQMSGRDPLDTEGLARLFRRGGALLGYEARAYSLVEAALWDIKGKAWGTPVYRLLGGARDNVDCYASWNVEQGLDETALAGHAREHVAAGFRSMKSHVGGLDRAGLIRHMQVMREAVGEDVEIMLDVTQRWSVDQAIEYGRAVLPYRPYWLEDPLPHEDYEGLRRVREALDTPVCAGEAYRSVVPFRHMLTNRSVDIAMIDLDVGLSGFMRIAHLAEAFGLPVVTHLAPEILAHGIAATPNGLTVEYIPWATPLFREAPRLQGGQLLLSGLPGLGLELDEAGLQKYAL